MRIIYELVVYVVDEHGDEPEDDTIPERLLEAISNLIPTTIALRDHDDGLQLMGLYVKHAHVEGVS
jgi:hypothetical protein